MPLPATIVDSHVHGWNPQGLRLDWLSSFCELNRPFLPAHFGQARTGANPDQMIFVECGGAPSPALAEVDWENWNGEPLRPYVETALAAYGYDRVLFGGDWPVSMLATSYQRWLETVSQLTEGASDVDRQKRFQVNPESIYRI